MFFRTRLLPILLETGDQKVKSIKKAFGSNILYHYPLER